MKFEVNFGNHSDTYYCIVEASTSYQACILALQQCAEIQDEIPIGPFSVINLNTDDEENIPMSLILKLVILANN